MKKTNFKKNLPYIIPICILILFIIFKIFTLDISFLDMECNLKDSPDIVSLLKEAKQEDKTLEIKGENDGLFYCYEYESIDITGYENTDLKLENFDEYDNNLKETLDCKNLVSFEFSKDVKLNGTPKLIFYNLKTDNNYYLFEIRDGNLYYLSDTVTNKDEVSFDVSKTSYVYVLASGVDNNIISKAKNNKLEIETSSNKEKSALINATSKKGEEENQQKKKKYYCNLMIECKEAVENIDSIKEEKRKYIPSNGYIYGPKKVSFYEGENLYEVLSRELKNAGIPLDASGNSKYSTVYVKGINNIYEFDLGSSSGWVYYVNGKQPNYGCSDYILKSGDEVIWKYIKGR